MHNTRVVLPIFSALCTCSNHVHCARVACMFTCSVYVHCVRALHIHCSCLVQSTCASLPIEKFNEKQKMWLCFETLKKPKPCASSIATLCYASEYITPENTISMTKLHPKLHHKLLSQKTFPLDEICSSFSQSQYRRTRVMMLCPALGSLPLLAISSRRQPPLGGVLHSLICLLLHAPRATQ